MTRTAATALATGVLLAWLGCAGGPTPEYLAEREALAQGEVGNRYIRPGAMVCQQLHDAVDVNNLIYAEKDIAAARVLAKERKCHAVPEHVWLRGSYLDELRDVLSSRPVPSPYYTKLLVKVEGHPPLTVWVLSWHVEE